MTRASVQYSPDELSWANSRLWREILGLILIPVRRYQLFCSSLHILVPFTKSNHNPSATQVRLQYPT